MSPDAVAVALDVVDAGMPGRRRSCSWPGRRAAARGRCCRRASSCRTVARIGPVPQRVLSHLTIRVAGSWCCSRDRVAEVAVLSRSASTWTTAWSASLACSDACAVVARAERQEHAGRWPRPGGSTIAADRVVPSSAMRAVVLAADALLEVGPSGHGRRISDEDVEHARSRPCRDRCGLGPAPSTVTATCWPPSRSWVVSVSADVPPGNGHRARRRWSGRRATAEMARSVSVVERRGPVRHRVRER